MDLLALVDRLEELVGTAQKMPIGSRAIVDRRRLLDMVDQMRVAIPQEVRDAQEMVASRDSHRREAEEEAGLVIARAEDRAARMVEAHELTEAARKRAAEVAREAERRLEERIQQANSDIEQRIAESRRLASQQMDAADEYARELLERLDRQLQSFVRSVEAGIAQLDTNESSRHPLPESPAPEPTEAYTRSMPTPLRRDDGNDERSGEPTSASEGLQNLLRRRPRAVEVDRRDRGDEASVVINDFDLPELDDEPSRIREDKPLQ